MKIYVYEERLHKITNTKNGSDEKNEEIQENEKEKFPEESYRKQLHYIGIDHLEYEVPVFSMKPIYLVIFVVALYVSFSI